MLYYGRNNKETNVADWAVAKLVKHGGGVKTTDGSWANGHQL